jgi:Flp pilus assembly protein TadG
MTSLTRFFRDDSGSISLVFGFILLPILASVALAVDYGTMVTTRSKLQAAIDSAALNAALKPSAGLQSSALLRDPVPVNADYFNSIYPGLNIDGDLRSATVMPSSDGSGVTAKATVRYRTKFGIAIGRETVDIDVEATAQRPNGAVVLDVAMCIDATGSMQPTLNAVKTSALSFYTDLNAALAAKNIRAFDAVRVRPIYFRDYGGNAARYSVANGGQVDKYPLGWENRPAGDARNLGDDVPLRAAANFFNLFDKSADFDQFVSGELEAGGGDDPESGLECLNEAISSSWVRKSDTVRTANGDKQATTVYLVIAHWTDNDAQPPGYGPSLQNPNYPPASKMPRNYADLQAKWDNDAVMPQANKLLAFFTPSGVPDVGYQPIKAWNRFLQAGTLSDGTTAMVQNIANAVAQIPSGPGTARLMN